MKPPNVDLSASPPFAGTGFFIDPLLLQALRLDFSATKALVESTSRPTFLFRGVLGNAKGALYPIAFALEARSSDDPIEDGDRSKSKWTLLAVDDLVATGPDADLVEAALLYSEGGPHLSALPLLAQLRLKWVAEGVIGQMRRALIGAGRMDIVPADGDELPVWWALPEQIDALWALSRAGKLRLTGEWVTHVETREVESGLMTEARTGVAETGAFRVGGTSDTEGMNPTENASDPQSPKPRLRLSYTLSEYCDPEAVAATVAELVETLSKIHQLNGGTGLRLVKSETLDGVASPSEVPG